MKPKTGPRVRARSTLSRNRPFRGICPEQTKAPPQAGLLHGGDTGHYRLLCACFMPTRGCRCRRCLRIRCRTGNAQVHAAPQKLHNAPFFDCRENRDADPGIWLPSACGRCGVDRCGGCCRRCLDRWLLHRFGAGGCCRQPSSACAALQRHRYRFDCQRFYRYCRHFSQTEAGPARENRIAIASVVRFIRFTLSCH